jgi:hypothetical protein
MEKTHELKTIEDVCKIATSENFERLILDLADCVAFNIQLKKQLSEKEYSDLKMNSIIWKDDNIKGMTSLRLNGEEILISKKK